MSHDHGQRAQGAHKKRIITSPRCVMASDLASPPSARLSPVMVQEQNNQSTIRKVKILVLQGNFKDALQIGNEYLQQQIRNGWTGPLSYFQTTFQLYVPLTVPSEVIRSSTAGTMTSYTFQVRLGTQLTAVDEVTTLVLQCWYELAKKDSNNNNNNRTKAWRHLVPLLDVYSRHPMPLQFLVEFWIPFWHSFPWTTDSDTNNFVMQQCALCWSCQVAIFLMEHSNRIDNLPVLIQELRDQLILFLVTEQLSKVSSPTLATKLLKMLLLLQPLPTSEEWKELLKVPCDIQDPVGTCSTKIVSSVENPRSIYALRQVLEEMPDTTGSTTSTTNTTTTFSKELRDKILLQDKFQNLPSFDLMTQPSFSMIPQWKSKSLLLPSKWIHFFHAQWQSIMRLLPVDLQSRLWKQWCQNAKTILISSGGTMNTTKTSHTATTTAGDIDDPRRSFLQQYKGQLAISIVSILLAWRWKGWLKQWGRACSMAVLAPFTELVDALVPPKAK